MPAKGPRSQKPHSAAARAAREAVDSEAIVLAANAHIVRHYPFGCLSGTPRRLTLGQQELWIVPIVLTSPGYGPVGEVGVVALEARTHQVVGGTPRPEVGTAVQRLKEEKHDELQTAFHRARTT